MSVKCEIIHVGPEIDRICGKNAIGYSIDGTSICLTCADDDTLKIVRWIGPCLDETKMHGYCDQFGGSDDPFDDLLKQYGLEIK